MKQAVILAGGRGTRLAERLRGRPKPLIDVDGTPLLGRQLALLRAEAFDEAVVLVQHAQEQIRTYCAENDPGLAVRIIEDGEAKGTAGAVLAALETLNERFLVVYGDTLLDVDLAHLWHVHVEGGGDATLLLHPNDHPHDSDLVDLDTNGFIRNFHPYPHASGFCLPNLVNAALYMIERRALQLWVGSPPPLDFAKDLFPRMLQAGQRLRGYRSFEYIKDVGTPSRLDKAVRHLRSGLVARARRNEAQVAVFLDRDGTLNQLRGYVRTADQLELIPGVPKAVARLNEAEHRAVVITNQPVLARGEASVEEMARIHAKLETELGRCGAYVDRIYYCPHHPDGGFPGEIAALKVACACRKPGIGLILEAQRDMNIDLTRSWLVGDSSVDLLAARSAGLRSILVRTGEGGADGRQRITADTIVDDLPAAVSFILDVAPALRARVGVFAADIQAGAVVLIGGPARLGKTTLAQALAWRLQEEGREPTVIALDRFIRTEADRAPGVGGRYALDELRVALGPWLREQARVTLSLPWYDRAARRSYPASDEITLVPDAVLILEGVPALTLDLDTSRPVHAVSLTGDEVHRHARVVADLVARGMPTDEAERIAQARQADEVAVIEAQAPPRARRVVLDDLLSPISGARAQ